MCESVAFPLGAAQPTRPTLNTPHTFGTPTSSIAPRVYMKIDPCRARRRLSRSGLDAPAALQFAEQLLLQFSDVACHSCGGTFERQRGLAMMRPPRLLFDK